MCNFPGLIFVVLEFINIDVNFSVKFLVNFSFNFAVWSISLFQFTFVDYFFQYLLCIKKKVLCRSKVLQHDVEWYV